MSSKSISMALKDLEQTYSKLLAENSNMKNQIYISKQNIKNNKEALMQNFKKFCNKKEFQSFQDFQKSQEILINKIEENLDSKLEYNKGINKIKSAVIDKSLQEQEIWKKTDKDISLYQNKIQEKNKEIRFLKNKLENAMQMHQTDFRYNLLVSNPTKAALEINTELAHTNDLIEKYKKILIQDREQNKILDIEIIRYKQELEVVKNQRKKNESDTKKIIPEELQINSKSDGLRSYSSSESQNEEGEDKEKDLPSYYFPDKILMKRSFIDLELENSTKLAPKLDLEKIKDSYVILSNYLPKEIKVKSTIIPDFTKVFENKKYEDKQVLNKIENLKLEIASTAIQIQETRQELETENRENRNSLSKLNKLNENLKLANNKITFLNSQMKDSVYMDGLEKIEESDEEDYVSYCSDSDDSDF